MRKIITLALTLAFLVAASGTPASANWDGQQWIGNDVYTRDYTWSSNNGGLWVDNACGTSAEKFNVTLYKHISSQSQTPKVKVCTYGTHISDTSISFFCDVPMGTASNVYSMFECRFANGLGITSGTAQDKISRIKVNSIKGSQPKCIKLADDWNYGGDYLRVPAGADWNLTGRGFNDRASSIRKKTGAWCE